MLALILAIAGSALLVGSMLTLRHKRGDTESIGAAWTVCEAPSPDDSLMCDQEIGHYGWHRQGESSWYGDAWDIDQWADTQEAPPVEQEPTLSADEWAKANPPASIPAPDPLPADLHGRKPLKHRIGLFGTRHPIEERPIRESTARQIKIDAGHFVTKKPAPDPEQKTANEEYEARARKAAAAAEARKAQSAPKRPAPKPAPRPTTWQIRKVRSCPKYVTDPNYDPCASR